MQSTDSVTAELMRTLRMALASHTGSPVNVEMHNHFRGNLYSVWVDSEIIGTGEAESEALESAIRFVRRWTRLAAGQASA